MLPLWLLLVGGSGHSAVPGPEALAIVGSIDLTLHVDQLATSYDQASSSIVPSFVHVPGEDLWTAPELFFESEEELREHIDPEEDTERDRSNAISIGSTSYRPLVYSVNDPSAVVGRGRHFNAAPPMLILLGVLRV